MKDRQYNGQKKKYKRQTMIYKTLYRTCLFDNSLDSSWFIMILLIGRTCLHCRFFHKDIPYN
jgi:hypothetical protein